MTPPAVYQFETGRARPTRAKLEAIVGRLGIPIESVLADARDPRESRMAEFAAQHRYGELGRLARRVLRDASAMPRVRAHATYYAGRAILNEAPKVAVRHFRNARRLLMRSGDPFLSAEATDWEAAALYLMEDPLALEVGRAALARYRTLPDRDSTVESRMLEHIGTYLLQRGEHVEAMNSYRQAIEVAGAVLDLGRLANIYHGLATSCLQAGQVRQGLDYMERAVNFYRTEHDVRGPLGANLARTENGYGCQLMRHGHVDRAEEMIRASLHHFGEIGVEAGRSAALLSMGELRQLQGNIDEAMDWTAQALELADRLGETVSLGIAYQQLGELWAAKSEEERFEASFSRALEIFGAAGLIGRRNECLARYRSIRDSVGSGLVGA